MTREEIIRMAREAHRQLVIEDYPGHLGQLDPWTMRLLERFAALVEARLMQPRINRQAFEKLAADIGIDFQKMEEDATFGKCWYITSDGLERFANLVAAHERAALAEPEVKQKPVAWMDREGDLYKMPEIEGWAPPHTLLYAAPPRREWRGLTEEEIKNLWKFPQDQSWIEAVHAAIRRAEAQLKEKNHDARRSNGNSA